MTFPLYLFSCFFPISTLVPPIQRYSQLSTAQHSVMRTGQYSLLVRTPCPQCSLFSTAHHSLQVTTSDWSHFCTAHHSLLHHNQQCLPPFQDFSSASTNHQSDTAHHPVLLTILYLRRFPFGTAYNSSLPALLEAHQAQTRTHHYKLGIISVL